MEQIDLMNILQDVDFNTVDLIGQQQLTQIESLKIQVESLVNQLEEKNEEIGFLRKRQHKTIFNISQIIRELLKTFDSSEKKLIDDLQSIDNERDVYSKVERLSQFLYNYGQSSAAFASRVCSLLNDHLKLIEQANSGEITTFAVSSPKTMQKILLSQAEKTKEFLETSQIKESSVFPKVSEILDFQFTAELRTEEIKKFINSSEMSKEELKILLFQEIVFVDSLRNYIQDNNLKANNNKVDLQKQTEQIERKLKAELERQVRTEIEDFLRIEITNNLTEHIRIQAESDLKDKIEAEIRLSLLEQQRNISAEMYDKVRIEVEQELKPKIESKLREKIVDECCQKGTALYNQILAKIQKSQKNENCYNDLSCSHQKRKEVEFELRESLQNEFDQKEKQLKERAAAEAENKFRSLEKQLRIDIESSLRSKIEIELYNKISRSGNISQNACNLMQTTDLPEDIEAVSSRLCAALGIANRHFLTFSQFSDTITSLLNKVIKIRNHFHIKGRSIISPLLDLEKQVSHRTSSTPRRGRY